MFRTLYITQGDKINIENNWLVVTGRRGSKKIPIEDIQSLVIDNVQTNISVYTLQLLAKHSVNTVLCDARHMPCVSMLPFGQHYMPYGVLKKQIALEEDFKNLLWQKIIKAKITNQITVLKLIGSSRFVCEKMQQFADEVSSGDVGNREAVAAKMFFRHVYGFNFIRFDDDIVNSALDYGYAIIRSAVARSLAGYGYNLTLGIHHINVFNAFNLADDFMEPLRPLVDLWAFQNNDDLVNTLSKSNKMELVNLLNKEVLFDNKKMKLYNAVDRYIASFTTAIDNEDTERLIIPYIGEGFCE